MTFGVMPSREEFDRAFEEETKDGEFTITIPEHSASCEGFVAGLESANIDITAEWISGQFGEPRMKWTFTAATLWAMCSAFAHCGDEDLEGWASSCMDILGFEWI